MKINGMTRAAMALQYWERKQEVVANNLANVDTTGFRAERVFARLLEGEITVADVATDLRNGTFKQTGNPLDFALAGDGFFVVQTPEGERITRAGSFRLDEGGRLVDQNGNPVLGEQGEIVVPPGTVTVDGTGLLRVDDKEIGRFRIETIPPGSQLEHAGASLFVPPDGMAALPEADRTVRQGYLEDSNVSSIGSMVDMISIQRAYSAVQKTVVTLDGIRETISTQLGRPV